MEKHCDIKARVLSPVSSPLQREGAQGEMEMPFSWTTSSSSFMRYFAQIHLIPTPKQWGGYFKFPCHQISHSLLLPGWQSPNWDNNVPRFKTNYGDAFGSPLRLGAGGVCLSGMVLAREMSSELWVWPLRKLFHWGWWSWHLPFAHCIHPSPHLDLILGSWSPCSRLPRMKIKDRSATQDCISPDFFCKSGKKHDF